MRIAFFLYLFLSSFVSFTQNDSTNFFLSADKNDTIKAAGLIGYAYRLEEQGQIKTAIRALTNCSKLTKKKELIKFYIRSEKLRAFLLTKINNYDEATLVADQLLSYSTENNSLIGRAYSKRLYAIIEMNKGNVDVAVKKYLETQLLWEDTKDSTLIIEGLSDIGLAFFFQQDYKRAVKYLKKTVDYYVFHKRIDDALGALSNMSTSYIELKEDKEAKKILQFILPIAIRNNSTSMLINVYQNLAYLERREKNLDGAIAYTLKALDLLENSDEFSRIGSLYMNLGEFHRDKREYKKAKEYLFFALRFAKRSNNLLKIARSYENISLLYADQRQFETALAYQDSSIIINDSIFTVEKQEGIVKLEEEQKEFKIAAKEQEIASLTKDQLLKDSELKKQRYLIYSFVMGALLLLVIAIFIYRNLKIKKEKERKDLELLLQNAELTALKAQMNPHFIFNALNSIQHSIVVNNTEEAYRFLAKFSKLIRNILDNSSQQLVALTTETETLSLYMDVESKRFDNSFEHKIIINNPNNLEQEKILIPPMMLQPFIENAIWHGLMPKDGPKLLCVAFNILSEQKIVCEIKDNGIGRAEAKKIAELKGKKHRSKGLTNIYDRIKLLEKAQNYKVEITMKDNADESGKATGTDVIVKFEKLKV